MTLRSNLFWGREFLTGGRIRDHFDDVQTFNCRDAKVASRCLERLNKHLDHVTKNVPYCRQYSGATSLHEFPPDLAQISVHSIAPGSDPVGTTHEEIGRFLAGATA